MFNYPFLNNSRNDNPSYRTTSGTPPRITLIQIIQIVTNHDVDRSHNLFKPYRAPPSP